MGMFGSIATEHTATTIRIKAYELLGEAKNSETVEALRAIIDECDELIEVARSE